MIDDSVRKRHQELTQRYSIYQITNLINGKIYIGYTSTTPQNRFHKGHVYNALKRNSKTRFCNAIRKYGIDQFKIELLCTTSSLQEAKDLEIKFIFEKRSYESKIGYNSTKGGDGTTGITWKMSEETKTKIGNANRGKPKPPRTEEHKKNLRLGSKHRKLSSEERTHLSRVLTGRKRGPYSDEYRKAISLGKRQKNGRKIIQLTIDGTFIMEFASMVEAIRSMKLPHNNPSMIWHVCNHRAKVAYGYIWMYKDEYDQRQHSQASSRVNATL